MNRLHETLKKDAYFEGKLQYNETENCLLIVFNEYLCLAYYEGDYTSSADEGSLFVKSPKQAVMHWHIQADEEAFAAITAFAQAEDVYIENVNADVFTFAPLRIVSKEAFEKKKDKLLANKNLRIYTANTVIKRA